MLYTIITGWSSGIGLQITNDILEKSHDKGVIIIDIVPPPIQNTRCIFLEYDLSKPENLHDFLELNISSKYTIVAIINNAGYQEQTNALDVTLEQIHKLYNVIVYSPVVLSQWFTKRFIKSWLQNGRIINITSIHSEIIREIPHYSSAKSALKMRTKEFAYELRNNSITVNAVAPGAILTPLLQKDLYTSDLCESAAQQIPIWKLWMTNEVSSVILFLLSHHSSYITGIEIVVDGGLSLVI